MATVTISSASSIKLFSGKIFSKCAETDDCWRQCQYSGGNRHCCFYYHYYLAANSTLNGQRQRYAAAVATTTTNKYSTATVLIIELHEQQQHSWRDRNNNDDDECCWHYNGKFFHWLLLRVAGVVVVIIVFVVVGIINIMNAAGKQYFSSNSDNGLNFFCYFSNDHHQHHARHLITAIALHHYLHHRRYWSWTSASPAVEAATESITLTEASRRTTATNSTNVVWRGISTTTHPSAMSAINSTANSIDSILMDKHGQAAPVALPSGTASVSHPSDTFFYQAKSSPSSDASGKNSLDIDNSRSSEQQHCFGSRKPEKSDKQVVWRKNNIHQKKFKTNSVKTTTPLMRHKRRNCRSSSSSNFLVQLVILAAFLFQTCSRLSLFISSPASSFHLSHNNNHEKRDDASSFFRFRLGANAARVSYSPRATALSNGDDDADYFTASLSPPPKAKEFLWFKAVGNTNNKHNAPPQQQQKPTASSATDAVANFTAATTTVGDVPHRSKRGAMTRRVCGRKLIKSMEVLCPIFIESVWGTPLADFKPAKFVWNETTARCCSQLCQATFICNFYMQSGNEQTYFGDINLDVAAKRDFSQMYKSNAADFLSKQHLQQQQQSASSADNMPIISARDFIPLTTLSTSATDTDLYDNTKVSRPHATAIAADGSGSSRWSSLGSTSINAFPLSSPTSASSNTANGIDSAANSYGHAYGNNYAAPNRQFYPRASSSAAAVDSAPSTSNPTGRSYNNIVYGSGGSPSSSSSSPYADGRQQQQQQNFLSRKLGISSVKNAIYGNNNNNNLATNGRNSVPGGYFQYNSNNFATQFSMLPYRMQQRLDEQTPQAGTVYQYDYQRHQQQRSKDRLYEEPVPTTIGLYKRRLARSFPSETNFWQSRK